jgi:hypothetical protein
LGLFYRDLFATSFAKNGGITLLAMKVTEIGHTITNRL